MATYKSKVGDTFYAECTYQDADGEPVSLVSLGLTVASSLLSPDGRTRLELEIEVLDQTTYPGRFNVRGDTEDWMIGVSSWDIQYTSEDDFITSTDTVKICFAENVTL